MKKISLKILLLLLLSFNLFCSKGWSQTCVGNWCNCDTTTSQSPININTNLTSASVNYPISINFPGTQTYTYKYYAQVPNIEVLPPNHSTSIVYNGSKYVLEQIHAHAPSEHTINGKQYDFELHLVFDSSYTDGSGTKQSRKVVIALLGIVSPLLPCTNAAPVPFSFLINSDSTSLKIYNSLSLWAACLQLGAPPPYTGVSINLNNYITAGSLASYYTYQGSLTTSPCSENVTWIVCSNPVYTYSQTKNPLLQYPKYIHGARAIQKNKNPVYSVVPK